jgi:hypothetical protein
VAERINTVPNEQRIEFFETHYGFVYGWIVEHNDIPVAEINDPEYYDMFWTRWKVTPLISDASTMSALATDDFWASSSVRYRNKKLDVVTDSFTVCWFDYLPTSTVILRGYPVQMNQIRPSVMESLHLRYREFKRWWSFR